VPNLPVRPISRSLPNRAQMTSMELRMDRRTDFLSLLDRDTASSEEFGAHWGGLLEPLAGGSHRSFVNPIDQRQHLVSASTGGYGRGLRPFFPPDRSSVHTPQRSWRRMDTPRRTKPGNSANGVGFPSSPAQPECSKQLRSGARAVPPIKSFTTGEKPSGYLEKS
jgi:hypothetical protein